MLGWPAIMDAAAKRSAMRGQLVHAVAARRVAQEVHAVEVHPFGGDERLDQTVEQIIDVTLVPQVPRVGGGGAM